MAYDYIIRTEREDEWRQGQTLSQRLLGITQRSAGVRYYPVHGDPVLDQLNHHDLLCYFIYTLSSWWEIPLIDRINDNREDNNFAILMDINPAPETMYWLESTQHKNPKNRYKDGLRAMFPTVEADTANAMYNLLRNGFGHNLFGREPGKIRFDNSFDCPPRIDGNVLLVPPVRLAISMVNAFLAKIVRLLLFPSDDDKRVFTLYMTGKA